MTDLPVYHTAIIGGGLAGLSLSIQLSKQGYKVVVFEKETYPFHKVCGEYISMESWPFLESLGVPLTDLHLPRIKNLLVTAPDGTKLQTTLPLGGFGISRYTLDAMLRDIAVTAGVTVKDNCKVSGVEFIDDGFLIQAGAENFKSFTCCGCYGKKANLDVKWKRSFTLNKSRTLNQFTGIKYHVETKFPSDTIALHNFKNGYCGISKVNGDKYCLCYLTHTSNLQDSNQSIEKMEQQILSRNPHLKDLLEGSRRLFESPVTISQISFLQKTQVENHVLLLGDAAGMIAPLCGNGMSMALHASKLAAGHIDLFFQKKITRQELEDNYTKEWKSQFSRRLWFGRVIQYFFGNESMTNVFIRLMKTIPALTKWLIRQTHGKAF